MAPSAIPLFKVFVAPTAHAALKPVLESGWLAAGPQVAKFETQLAQWLDVPRCVALADASGALTLALYLAGVRPGSEVIASPMACSASVMPIANLFARPVWCDVDPLTGMIDPDSISRLVSNNTRALLLYHWSGNVADIGAIATVAKRHGIAVIEDASEAFGACAAGRRLGGEADFTVYSFYATKHINAGEGAALLAASPSNLDAAARLRRFGIDYSRFRLPNGGLNPEFDIPVAGYNLAMNEIAATIAGEALQHADEIVARHQANGAFYDAALASAPGARVLRQRTSTRSAYWTYSLLAERRDDLIRRLTTLGIGAQRLHVRQDGYACFGGRNHDLAGVAEFDAGNVSIPCGWWVGDAERDRIAESIRAGW